MGDHITVFAIDPGIAGTGWALVVCNPGNRFTLEAAGNLYSKEGTWQLRARDLSKQLFDTMHNTDVKVHPIDEVACEFPTYMEGMAVSSKTDSTIKMAFLVGRFVELIDQFPWPLKLYIPQQWKGTMSKTLVESRCRKHVDFNVRAHAIDAIGIGLKHLGAW